MSDSPITTVCGANVPAVYDGSPASFALVDDVVEYEIDEGHVIQYEVSVE